MPDAYDAMDQIYAAVMQYDREDGNGDRFFVANAHCDAVGGNPQEYFYRAMNRDEALGWLHPGRIAVPDPGGHHGWASYRNYSFGYLTRKNGYTYLLEVHAPQFLPGMNSIGFTSGKAEGGDMSWGIGGATSNAWSGNKQTNKTLEGLFKQKFPDVKTKDVKGGLRGMAKPLAPLIFKDAIQSVTIVNLRSQKP